MSERNIYLNADHVRHQIEALRAEYPELAEDDQLLLDTVEAETDAHKVLTDIVRVIREAETNSAAVADYIGTLKARREAFERRAEGYRQLAQRIMASAGLRKLALPEATLSIRATPPAVVVPEPDRLPEAFWRIAREPNKTAIKAALLDKQDVPGAFLTNGGESLAVRI